MIPMVKVVLLAGPALTASYTAHPTRIKDPRGGIMQALELDLMDLLNLSDTSHIPPVVRRDLIEAISRAIDGDNPSREPTVIGLSHHAGRHPMYKGGMAPISVRVVRC